MSEVQALKPAPSVTPGTDAVMRSPIHRHHVELGCHFIQQAGWELPGAYQAVDDERDLIRGGGLAIGDITARSKVDLRGAIDDLRTRHPIPQGATFCRLSPTWALVLDSPGALQGWTASAEEAAGASAMLTDATSAYAGFVLVGATVPDLLARLTTVDPELLRPGVTLGMPIVKIPSIVVARERSVEIYVGSEYGRYAWESLLALGQPLKLRPVGWEALRAEGILT